MRAFSIILLGVTLLMGGCAGFDGEGHRDGADRTNRPIEEFGWNESDAAGNVHGMPSPSRLPQEERLGEAGTLLDRLIEEDRFHRFLAVALRGGALPQLRDQRPLIVLAPTDDAFRRLSTEEWAAFFEQPDRARRFIQTHILPMPNGPRPLRRVDPTFVAETSLPATNGTVLVIGRVRLDHGPGPSLSRP